MLTPLHEKILIGIHSVGELVHFEERVTDVSHNLKAARLHAGRKLVKCHAVHLDCSCPFLLLEIDVPHVHAEASACGVLLVFDDLRVDGDGLVIVAIRIMHDCQMKAYGIGEVYVELIEQVLLFTQTTGLTFLLPSLLGQLEGFPEIAIFSCKGALLDCPMDIFLHVPNLFFRGKLGLLQLCCRLFPLVHRVELVARCLLASSSVTCSTI
mmetsp:Transcript_23696/g.42927  ORF Transcript_23696/g.42927 Transcript_23696/m.42927 type:complete len:210 (-) Transcript_23696:295-924(-)